MLNYNYLETPIGTLPAPDDLHLKGLQLDRSALEQLLSVDPAAWRVELSAIGDYLDTFGPNLPERLRAEQQRVADALDESMEQPRREAIAR